MYDEAVVQYFLEHQMQLFKENVAELGSGCISRWKDGKVSPNIDTLKKIANVIGVKVADLVKE